MKRQADGQFGLAPADFDMTTAKFITGSVLNQWLIDSKCKARQVVFILDCCYAGGLGTDVNVTAGVPNLRSGLYVLSASTALEAQVTHINQIHTNWLSSGAHCSKSDGVVTIFTNLSLWCIQWCKSRVHSM